jgi:putative pre-16S rRNA nuclease
VNKVTVRASIGRAPASVGSQQARGRILAIDYGRRRIGLALSDELGLTAQPLAILVRMNRRADLCSLREICRRHAVEKIVVGYPLHMTGEAGEMAAEVSRFALRLGKNLGMTVELVDERLTSWEAKQGMAKGKSRRGKSVDDVAAALILRGYLDQLRASKAPLSSDGPSGVR